METILSNLQSFGSPEPPLPSELVSAPANGLYADIFFAIIGVSALVWGIVLLVRRRNIVPLLLILGGALVAVNEPIVDVLGKIIYPTNYTWKFMSFDRVLPLWLIPPYMAALGIFPYYVAGAMQQKSTKRKTFYIISALAYVSIFCLDFVVSKTGHYQYYGEGPFKTLAGSLVMAAYPIVGGYALLHAYSRRGIGAKLAVFFIPSIAFAASFAATSFPLCFALNTDLPPVPDLLFRLLSVAQTVGVAWFVIEIVSGEKGVADQAAGSQIQFQKG